jgi:Tfp pilus assembly protein PilZ
VPKKYGEEFCPILDVSRGGLRFVGQNNIKIDSKITMKISIPGERIPLILKGQVRWSVPNPGKSYKYQIGIQFNPYGEKKGQNYPGNLVKIIALEQKFRPPDMKTLKDSATGDFEIDG